MEVKKRILLTSPGALNNGGVQYVLMTIVRNLSSIYTFDILTFNSYQNFYKKEFLSFGGKIICLEKKEYSWLPLRIISKISFVIKLRRFLSKIFKLNDYYAVHCNSQFASAYILKYAKKYGVKKRICHSHGTYKNVDFFREIFRNHSRKMIKNNATLFLGCSDISCRTFYRLDTGYQIINNPFDNINIVYCKETPKVLTLLQIGMFCENKNQVFSINVLYHLRKIYPKAILRLVGTGDTKYLEKTIDKFQLNDSVIFHEHNEDKMYLFKNSSFFVMPSISEGFGITLIEAQAAGLNCFASNSITEETNRGGVFYFSLDDGPEEWANKISSFFKKTLGKKERFDCSEYSISNFINIIQSLYEN